MPAITIYTRNPATGKLADVGDLAVGLRVNGSATGSVSLSHPATGTYLATFTMPTLAAGQVAELVASSTASEDAFVVWRSGDVSLNDLAAATSTITAAIAAAAVAASDVN